MDLREIGVVEESVLPVAGFRAHLRLGTGFADNTSQDGELAQYLRAAMATIEARCGKALLARDFRLTLPVWRWADSQALPVAPVSAVAGVTLRDREGVAAVADPGRWRLVADTHRPRIVARGAVLPPIPAGGQAEIDFTAGFGASWAEVPADLAQAVFLLAAHYHEARSGAVAELPVSVAGLVGRWQPIRVTAGGHQR